MKALNPIQAAAALIEEMFAAVADPAAHVWSLGFIQLAASLASEQFAAVIGRGRMDHLAAYALSTWPAVEREAFLAEYSVPQSVLDRLAAGDVPVPDPAAVAALEPLSEEDQARYRERAAARIASDAEQLRSSVITSGSGKALTYQAKLAELQRYDASIAASKTPKASDYPYISAEVGITGDDMESVAEIWRLKRDAWTAVNADIEAEYLRGRAAVRDPETPIDDIDGIVAATREAIAGKIAVLAAV